jgi:CRP-like cAMP-binding protein
MPGMFEQRLSEQPAAAPSPRLLRGLDERAVQEITAAATAVRRARGTVLFRQGSSAASFYLLRSGRAKLTQLNRDGQLVLLRLIVPGEAFGGIAVLGNRVYPVTAEAVEDCVALAWSGRVIERLMRRHPQLAINLIELIAERLHEMQSRYEELATQQVEQRLARMLLRLVNRAGRRIDAGVLVDIRLSSQDLAEMTGTTLFTVSRILTRWQQAGIIQTARQRIVVRHPHGLVGVAEDLPPGR